MLRHANLMLSSPTTTGPNMQSSWFHAWYNLPAFFLLMIYIDSSKYVCIYIYVYKSSWWFQPISKNISPNWIISPSFRVKKKELPPPRYTLYTWIIWVWAPISFPARGPEKNARLKTQQRRLPWQLQATTCSWWQASVSPPKGCFLKPNIKWQPSRELRYALLRHFWRWFSFSQDGVC